MATGSLLQRVMVNVAGACSCESFHRMREDCFILADLCTASMQSNDDQEKDFAGCDQSAAMHCLRLN